MGLKHRHLFLSIEKRILQSKIGLFLIAMNVRLNKTLERIFMMKKLFSLSFVFVLSATSMFAANGHLLDKDGNPIQAPIHPELLLKLHQTYHKQAAPGEQAALTKTEELEALLWKIKSPEGTVQDLATALELTKNLRESHMLSLDDYRKALKTILHTEIRENHAATTTECSRLLAEYFNPQSAFRLSLTEEEKAAFVSAVGRK